MYDSEMKNSSIQNKAGQLTITNYTFESIENFQYLVLYSMKITITK